MLFSSLILVSILIPSLSSVSIKLFNDNLTSNTNISLNKPPVIFGNSFTFLPNYSLFVSIGGRVFNNNTNQLKGFNQFLNDTNTPYASQNIIGNVLFLNATSEWHWFMRSELDTTIPPYIVQIFGHTASKITDNEILVLFGTNSLSKSWAGEVNLVSVLDLTTLTWRKLSTNGTVPQSRHHHVTAFNSTISRVYMLGGVLQYTYADPIITTSIAQTGLLESNRLFYLDLPLSDPSQPGSVTTNSSYGGVWQFVDDIDKFGNAGAAASSVVLINDLILNCFGSSSSSPTNKCTLFNTTTMTFIQHTYNETALPPAREGASMVYIEELDEVVLFGGMNLSANLFYNDIWILKVPQLLLSFKVEWIPFEAIANNSPKIELSPSSTSSSLSSTATSSITSVPSSPTKNSTNDTSYVPIGKAFHGSSFIQYTKLVIWGGMTNAQYNISSDISVFDMAKLSWLPLNWEPKDGIETPIVFVVYATISLGIAVFIAFAVLALLMGLKFLRTKYLKTKPRRKNNGEKGGEKGGEMMQQSFSSSYTTSSRIKRLNEVKIIGMSDDEGEMGSVATVSFSENQTTMVDDPFSNEYSRENPFLDPPAPAIIIEDQPEDGGWKKLGRFQVRSSFDEPVVVGRFQLEAPRPSNSSAYSNSSDTYSLATSTTSNHSPVVYLSPQHIRNNDDLSDDGYGSLNSRES